LADEEVLEQLLLGEQLLVLAVKHRLHHVLPEVVLDQGVAVDLLAVLGGDQHLDDLHRAL
jgi:hypothetical protein